MRKIIEYFGIDGLLHIICSIIIISILKLFLPLYIAVIITAAIGLGKELVWDKWLGKGTFDKKDLFADVIGILIGCI